MHRLKDKWPHLKGRCAQCSELSGLEPRVVVSTKEFKKPPIFFGGPLTFSLT